MSALSTNRYLISSLNGVRRFLCGLIDMIQRSLKRRPLWSSRLPKCDILQIDEQKRELVLAEKSAKQNLQLLRNDSDILPEP
jgi:hypothetical protein